MHGLNFYRSLRIVFFQLWPFYCHEQTAGPYKRGKNGDDSVRCSLRYGGSQVVSLFPFVGKLLRLLSKQGSIQLAIASRSPDETAARGILDTLGLLDLFCCLQIYSGSKATHFKAIQTCTGLPFRKMLFFDDERANIEAVAKLGVCCLHVGKEIGLTPGAVQAGFKKYREACLSRSSLQKWLQPREDVCPKSVTSKRGVMNQHVFDV
ncbi:unnamed protein product [Choristocarpus tenellus]